MANSQPPKDLIVMTRLNTVGLKRLAEGTLVEKKPFESRPPEPVRISGGGMSGKSSTPPPVNFAGLPAAPLPMSGPPTLLEEDELGPDADDRTLALGADGSEDRTVAAPLKTPPPPALPPVFGKAALSPPSYPPPPVDVRLEMETPTAMFVKDIQRTLQEELSKQSKHGQDKQDRFDAPTAAPPALKPISLADGDVEVDISPSTNSSKKKAAEAKAAEKKAEPAPLAFELKYEPLPAKAASVPPPPTSKPSSLAPPAKQSGGALPAPLPAQASRRKDPVAVSIPARSQRVERKGGFMPWAAALTALGVFVGVAGARVATGAPFLQAVTAPAAAPAAPPVMVAPASEPGFAPRVAVPTEAPAAAPAEPAKVAEKAPEPAPTPVVEAKVEPKVEAKEEKREDKPLAKVEEKVSAKDVAPKEVKAKPEPRVERPRRVAPPPPPAEEKVEKVAKAEKVEKVEKVEKPEPAPKPVKEPRKSSDVSNAAKDYANVESQIGPTL